MKASELIKLLQDIIDKEGDKDVEHDRDGCYCEINEVEFEKNVGLNGKICIS